MARAGVLLSRPGSDPHKPAHTPLNTPQPPTLAMSLALPRTGPLTPAPRRPGRGAGCAIPARVSLSGMTHQRLKPWSKSGYSREHGKSHGQTELAHEETEDEGASTRAAPPLSSHRRARHHAHHFALRISPRDERCRVAHNLPHEKLEVPRCTQSAAYLPLGLNSGCASSNFEYPPWVSKPEQQIS